MIANGLLQKFAILEEEVATTKLAAKQQRVVPLPPPPIVHDLLGAQAPPRMALTWQVARAHLLATQVSLGSLQQIQTFSVTLDRPRFLRSVWTR